MMKPSITAMAWSQVLMTLHCSIDLVVMWLNQKGTSLVEVSVSKETLMFPHLGNSYMVSQEKGE